MSKVIKNKIKATTNSGNNLLKYIKSYWNKNDANKIIAIFLFLYIYLPYLIIKYIFIFISNIIFLPLKIIFMPFRKKKKQCPKCDSFNLKEVKPTSSEKALPLSLAFLIGPLGLLYPRAKTLNVCRDCGFSWEQR